jgi:hypothetical protein
VAYVTVDESSEGQRIDNFLLKVAKGVPKSHIYRVLRSGEVRVNKVGSTPLIGCRTGMWCVSRRCAWRRRLPRPVVSCLPASFLCF